MSTFVVALRRIGRVRPHPNADRLDLAEVEGLTFQFIVPRGAYRSGDPVIYFPIDALLPDALAVRLGAKNYLAGPLMNRVKTARLRGEISQGLVASPKAVAEDVEWTFGVDYAPRLGVTKHDPPPIVCAAGTLRPLPAGVGVYDVEGGDQFPDLVDALLDEPCLITEKLEGANWSATRTPDGRTFVSQRQHTIEPAEGVEHDFWKAARELGWLDVLEALGRDRFPGRLVTLRGEFVGPKVQKNLYGLKRNEIFLFDIEVNGEPLGADAFLEAAEGRPTVPVLSRGATLRAWLAGRTLREASTGPSALGPKLREGVVVKPARERRHPTLGRLFVKQRSPEYLAATDF